LVEPLHQQLTRWEVLVVNSPEDGPVALVPAELERYSTLQELTEAHLALKEWQLMQVSSAIMQAAAVIVKVVAAVLCIGRHWVG
jgi:hypothetical protein